MVPQGWLWDLDRSLLLVLNGGWGAGWDTFWYLVSQGWFWAPLYVAFVGLAWWRLGWRRMLIGLALVVVGLALADQLANFFKGWHLTAKFRPTHTDILWDGRVYKELVHTVRGYVGGSFGTVSGHAATSTAVAVVSAGVLRNRWYGAAACCYVVLTCFSRIYLGVHFPMDIVFGVTAGTIIGLVMLWIYSLVERKFRL